MTRYIAASALGVVLLAAPASAHHAAAVAYHVDKTITVEGVVTEVKWENPHTWVYAEAKDASGNLVKWSFEGAVPNQLYRRGVTPAVLKPGVRVTIKGASGPRRIPQRGRDDGSAGRGRQADTRRIALNPGRRRHRLGALLRAAGLLVFVVVFPSVVFAQASITGVVRDTSGAVLPGVTVEAASPALIEKVRSAVTDGSGQYRIENLRPGIYSRHIHAAGGFARSGVRGWS